MPALHWDFEPSILIGITVLTGAYAAGLGPLRRRFRLGPCVPWMRQLAFYLGMVCAFAALVSPLDELGDETLFSAHMVQHILLTFIAPPLWLIGTPGWLIRRLIPERIWAFLTGPIFAFTLFNGVMWFWHIPAAYDAALEHPALHIFEHLMFMASAVLGWWPVLGPEDAGRMITAHKIIYLIPSLFSCTALAALITLSSIQLYPYYGSASLQWGLSPLADQQLGGLAMWLPGDMIYLFLIVSTVKALFDEPNSEHEQVKL